MSEESVPGALGVAKAEELLASLNSDHNARREIAMCIDRCQQALVDLESSERKALQELAETHKEALEDLKRAHQAKCLGHEHSRHKKIHVVAPELVASIAAAATGPASPPPVIHLGMTTPAPITQEQEKHVTINPQSSDGSSLSKKAGFIIAGVLLLTSLALGLSKLF